MLSRLYSLFIIFTVTLTFICFCPSQSQADFIDLQQTDLEGNSMTDTFITLDNRTGLEWLDVNLSINMTFAEQNELITTGIYSGFGFRFATREEFQSLITTVYGATLPIMITDESDHAMTLDFMEMIGITYELAAPGTADWWFCDGSLLDSERGLRYRGRIAHLHSYYYPESTDFNGTHIEFILARTDDYAGDIGAFFVREATPVPEPSSMLLLASSLFGLIAFTKKFLKK